MNAPPVGDNNDVMTSRRRAASCHRCVGAALGCVLLLCAHPTSAQWADPDRGLGARPSTSSPQELPEQVLRVWLMLHLGVAADPFSPDAPPHSWTPRQDAPWWLRRGVTVPIRTGESSALLPYFGVMHNPWKRHLGTVDMFVGAAWQWHRYRLGFDVAFDPEHVELTMARTYVAVDF